VTQAEGTILANRVLAQSIVARMIANETENRIAEWKVYPKEQQPQHPHSPDEFRAMSKDIEALGLAMREASKELPK